MPAGAAAESPGAHSPARHASSRDGSMSSLNPRAAEWYPPGYDAPHASDSAHAPAAPTAAALLPNHAHGDAAPADMQLALGTDSSGDYLELSELPNEILSSVLACLDSAEDVCACVAVNSQLLSAARASRTSLRLTDRQRQRLAFPSHASALDQLVHALTRYMPAMRACDLSTLPLEHTHISKLACGLRQLEHLNLSGCKKLQPGVTQLLLLQHSGRLRALNLQRCFQLTGGCLSDVLQYACGSGGGSQGGSSSNGSSGCMGGGKALQCVALSHLNLAAWAGADGSGGAGADGAQDSSSVVAAWREQAAGLLRRLPQQLGAAGGAATDSGGSSSQLRVLALNNCSMLTAQGLLVLALACPRLQYVFLGGSTLQTPAEATLPLSGTCADDPAGAYVPPRGPAPAAAAATEASAAGTQLPAALQKFAEYLQLPETLPWELLSRCCEPCGASSGCSSGGACSCVCGCCSRGRLAAAEGCGSVYGCTSAGEGAGQRASKRLCRNEPSAAAVAAARAQGLALAYMAALLPQLQAVEVSFMPPGVAGWLRVCMQRLQQLRLQQQQQQQQRGGYSHGGVVGGGGVKVWQFSCVSAVTDALQELQQARQDAARCGAPSLASSAVAPAGAVLDPACLEMAVRCAVNCSSRGRSTPLHSAADAGCACHVRALCAAGAQVAARDASGASPVFVAAEAGNADAAAALLAAGADCLAGNTAGETSLYIASLRGHVCVVERLLQHMAAAGVDWTQRQLYGDAWTPLMAAAVANRVDVALCLLQAADVRCRGGSQQQQHAWRSQRPEQHTQGGGGGSAGGSATAVSRLLAAENRYGQTVLHIAGRKGCREMLQLLLAHGAGKVAGRVVDAAGLTPLDVARRNGNEGAVRQLLAQCC